MGAKGAATRIAVNLVAWVFCLSYLFPFLWLFYNSLKDRKQFALDILSLPVRATWENYQSIFSDNRFYMALRNSLFNTAVSMLAALVFSFVVAYFLSRYRFRGRNAIYTFFILGLLIPIHALLIPIYIQFNRFSMLNKGFSLLIPYITFALPRDIYLFDGYMKGIPRSIEEAAFVDGANRNQIMTRVMFPICMPIVGTIMILDFLGMWNEFPFALVLVDSTELKTIPIWLTNYQSQYTSNVPIRLTTMLISVAPLIVMYLFFSERMMKGMVAGAVKG